MAQKGQAMTWTTQRPQKPGWYWLRGYMHDDMVVLFDGVFVRSPFWDAKVERIKEGTWFGPLEPPA
jgi:hypothetical protein